MKKRSPIAVFLLPFVTFGIYYIVWLVKTKGEMNQKGAEIPTAWLLIVPFVNIWWMWKYSEGVEKVTGGKTSTILAFLLILLLDNIGAAIVQDGFNKLAEGEIPPSMVASAGDVSQTTPTFSVPSNEPAVNQPQTIPPAPEAPANPTEQTPTPPTSQQV